MGAVEQLELVVKEEALQQDLQGLQTTAKKDTLNKKIPFSRIQSEDGGGYLKPHL